LASHLLALAMIASSGPAPREEPRYTLGPHALAAYSQSQAVPESSGVVASPTNPDVFWTHNDSGPYPARVYAFRLAAADRKARLAADLGFVELSGVRMVDWEDVAADPKGRIYILDGGDNPPCKRTDKTIMRFAEPKIGVEDKPLSLRVKPELVRFDYPDGAKPDLPASKNADRYDAECLLVDPKSGDIYLVTKRDNRNVARARVYKLPASLTRWDSPAIHLLEFVAEVSSRATGMITGGDVSPDGRRVVLRNYTTAFEFTLPVDSPFGSVFTLTPTAVSLLIEPQGEGICYAHDGRSLVTTSEVQWLGRRSFPIYITPGRPGDRAPRTPDGPH
jgi:hypothetical protein